jgi:hypothetical protein
MTDIVKRLRRQEGNNSKPTLYTEAAEEIERLREVLWTIANDEMVRWPARVARAALEGKSDDKESACHC